MFYMRKCYSKKNQYERLLSKAFSIQIYVIQCIIYRKNMRVTTFSYKDEVHFPYEKVLPKAFSIQKCVIQHNILQRWILGWGLTNHLFLKKIVFPIHFLYEHMLSKTFFHDNILSKTFCIRTYFIQIIVYTQMCYPLYSP